MDNKYHSIRVIDSHTEGEPTRLIVSGFPELNNKASISERLNTLKNDHDQWRKAVMLEPRGHDVLVGALLCKPNNPQATAGVIFFNNEGYLGMCGHGTIGLMASLRYLGLAHPGEHLIETPVGDVKTTLHSDNSVSIQNIYSYRYRKDVEVDVPSLGKIKGDIAWGGNWFFLVNQLLGDIHLHNVKQLTSICLAIKTALAEQKITGKNGAEIDHIELFQADQTADSKNFVLCPGGAYDRSPCGTGTSAKLACLAADKLLKEGEIWRQASIIGSQFEASYVESDSHGIIPTIKGTAYICADNTLLIDGSDPFRYGIFSE
ncbi:proline racemase family protein [Alcaligenes endophyticus]|uniref:Proline racemase family protein n=1 Tax=Alcaligenes endophyticus TaxID=1929088 RepID=A0ABT8EJ20_9BURK|nr:proline racemase family protein [Alcaligenes endophyticus]MCX5591610.1 proline racemase family protein [Alcaligenes endophyticus]MDN4121287.1 proline racemase family protein [Alcaligenes endophyticus]